MLTAPVVAVRYTGLVTRAIALAFDALLINTAAVVAGAVLALALSVLHAGSQATTVVAAISGVTYVVWSAAYFVVFWSTTGQTPGGHVMRFAVRDEASGASLTVRRSLLRVVGLTLAALPLCAGFVPILFDRRRRGFQDWIARSIVTDSEPRSRRAPGRGRPEL
jgi:uncharacterized RDD family membrane protein YckC